MLRGLVDFGMKNLHAFLDTMRVHCIPRLNKALGVIVPSCVSTAGFAMGIHYIFKCFLFYSVSYHMLCAKLHEIHSLSEQSAIATFNTMV